MRNLKRLTVFISAFLIMVLLPTMVSAATPSYKQNQRGGSKIDIASGSDAQMSYNVAGKGGKLSTDKIFTYESTNADTGVGYFSRRPSLDESTHDADSVFYEFNFFLTDENATVYFSFAPFNSSGYENFLSTGAHNKSGSGQYKSLNDLLQFSARGLYVHDSSSAYVDSAYRGKLFENTALTTGEWHTVSIRLPGLVNSVGTPKYDENGEVLKGTYNGVEKTVYAGEDEVYIYLDGTEYIVPLTKECYGARHVRMHARGKVYLDNILTAMTSALSTPSDYKNNVQMPNIATTSDILRIDGKAIKYTEEITAGALKEAFTGADAIRVYEDATCTTLVADNAVVEEGDVLVAASKSGDATYEKTYKYYNIAELKPLEIEGINLSEANGKILRGTQIERDLENQTYYLDTTIKNNTNTATELLRAVIAIYDENMEMTYIDYEDFSAAPGVNVYSAEGKKVKFEDVDIPRGYTLKAFLWKASDLEPLCENIEEYFGSDGEYHIIAFGNSYTNDSFDYLPAIAKADGVTLKAVNMYTGSCSLETHYNNMKNTSGTRTYEKRIEYLPTGNKIETEKVSFADGLNTEGYSWDFITMHQRSSLSPRYNTFYTEAKPYITEIADYIREESPLSEVLFFENWSVYTDRIAENLNDGNFNYGEVVGDAKKEDYYDVFFSKVKESYTNAAEKIGNPNRMVPAGEAVYLAVTKYGFEEYVDDSSTTNDYFDSSARAMYRDKSSHLTYYGKTLAALTWYEYITGNDVRNNPYTNSFVNAADMALLKEIAHEACSMAAYNPIK